MATDVDAKLLRQTKFPSEFNQKVDMTKVNLEVMKKWIAGKISDILGSEDDVVIELCFGLLEGSRFPDIKKLQIQLTGFLDKDTAKFCKELWSLCLSAQSNPQGVPKELLEAKKLELLQEKKRLLRKRVGDESKRKLENGRLRAYGSGSVGIVVAELTTVGVDVEAVTSDAVGFGALVPLGIVRSIIAARHLVGAEGEGFQVVVIHEHAPFLLLRRLAHVHLEDPGDNDLPHFHPAVVLRLLSLGTIVVVGKSAIDVDVHPNHGQDLVR
ncbi:hypothetical protein FGG08_002574 [Glutinoglossum americanum]|uniref:PWI domain-containing protein n=1 Tax=Glutinoglossum americanum TaxID=1670608 RepID=A0A9P8I601_9PEZI|nr:hypothetical protein FGG08_002574 [Glutinoglossum americanum]